MMSTSIPTKSPFASVNSKGGKTVSVATIYVSPSAVVSPSVVSSFFSSAGFSSVFEEQPASTPAVITAISDKAKNFFILSSSFL